MTAQNPLAVEVMKENLPESDALALQNSFLPFFEKAQSLKLIAESINVTGAHETELIEQAREVRLTLQKIRIGTETVRKDLKAESLRRGKAIDGMANIVKFLIVPLEERLEKQEKFVEIQMKEKVDAIQLSRVKELAQFGVDAMMYPDLGNMPNDLYSKLLEGAQASFILMQEAAQKLAQEKKEQEEAAQKDRERIQLENESLRKKNEEESIARRKAEKELHDSQEAARIEEEKQEAAARSLASAPDKDKLLRIADEIEKMNMPEVATPEAQKIIQAAATLLVKTAKFIQDSAAKL